MMWDMGGNHGSRDWMSTGYLGLCAGLFSMISDFHTFPLSQVLEFERLELEHFWEIHRRQLVNSDDEQLDSRLVGSLGSTSNGWCWYSTPPKTRKVGDMKVLLFSCVNNQKHVMFNEHIIFWV